MSQLTLAATPRSVFLISFSTEQFVEPQRDDHFAFGGEPDGISLCRHIRGTKYDFSQESANKH
jgi:hypothetical protein